MYDDLLRQMKSLNDSLLDFTRKKIVREIEESRTIPLDDNILAVSDESAELNRVLRDHTLALKRLEKLAADDFKAWQDRTVAEYEASTPDVFFYPSLEDSLAALEQGDPISAQLLLSSKTLNEKDTKILRDALADALEEANNHHR